MEERAEARVFRVSLGWRVDVKTGSHDNDHKYTDKEKDEDTGLYYYGARYYNPEAGVFTSQDPVYLALGTGSLRMLNDPQMLNSYSYSRNNPINMYDPDGRWPSWSKIVSGAQSFVNFVDKNILGGVVGAGLDVAEAAGRHVAQEGVSVRSVATATVSVGAATAIVGGTAGIAGAASGATAAVQGVKNVAVSAGTAVYSSINEVGTTVYVGITNNLERRAAEHAVTKGINIAPVGSLTNLTRDAARGVEQALIERHGLASRGGTLMNKINSIAPSNPSYQNLVEAGKKALENISN